MNVNFFAWLNVITYEMGDKDDYYPKFHKGWSVLANSRSLGLNKSGFNGVSYVNHDTKQLVIAYSGTTCFNMGFEFHKWYNCAQDMYANIQMYFGYLPTHHNDAQSFTDHSVKSINALDYNITLTGHSLGAVIANLMAVYLYGKHETYNTVVFESPGSKPAVSEYIRYMSLHDVTEEISVATYNGPPNLINTLNIQIGDIYAVPNMPYNYDIITSAIFYHSIESIISALDGISNEDIVEALLENDFSQIC